MSTAATPEQRALALSMAYAQRKAAIEATRPRWNPRPSQMTPPGDWRYWLILAGRGWGKTRVGAEETIKRAMSGRYKRLGIVGATVGDTRDIMIKGESGILAVAPRSFRPEYVPSRRELVFPNGCIAATRGADRPDSLVGLNSEFLWLDELAAWRRLKEAWDQLMMGFRIGPQLQAVITTTPRPLPLIIDLMERSSTHLTRGTTYENIDNLNPAFIEEVIKPYEGTAKGRQELLAEVLTDVEGALWRQSDIDACRLDALPDYGKGAVGIDPSGGAAEIGIVAGAKLDGDSYVILDDTSLVASPERWSAQALETYDQWDLDALVAETNYGGDMVAATIRQAVKSQRRQMPRMELVSASRGKRVRAEPVSLLSEKQQLYFYGHFPKLETELTTFVGNNPNEASPNRLDAMVWAMTYLMGKTKRVARPA
jgi:phage terminase large subunit-like protein